MLSGFDTVTFGKKSRVEEWLGECVDKSLIKQFRGFLQLHENVVSRKTRILKSQAYEIGFFSVSLLVVAKNVTADRHVYSKIDQDYIFRAFESYDSNSRE